MIVIDTLLDNLNNFHKKNNINKRLEWCQHLVNVASKDVKNISICNKYAENNNVKGFYHYDYDHYFAKDEQEIFKKITEEKQKKILLDIRYTYFGASFQNKHWVIYFGRKYARETIDINLLLKYTNDERIKVARKKISGLYWIENLGMNYETEKKAIQGWMGSSGHRKQILDKDYIYFGAGFSKDIW
ncbi:30646_t:CDS:2, partial [Racocetra persica]